MSDKPIIIKRIKKGGHGAHGGSWKVAYADFMTAMMAFFLLLWLLNSVTEEQLMGISNYFAPTAVSPSPSGAGGMLGGLVLGEGAMQETTSAAPTDQLTLPPPTIGSGGTDFTDPRDGGADRDENWDRAQMACDPADNCQAHVTEGDRGRTSVAFDGDTAFTGLRPEGTSESGLKDGDEGDNDREAKTDEQIADELQDAEFERRAIEIREALEAVPSLAALSQNLLIDNTPEGLRIQLVDQEGLSMFDRGSARLLPHTERLMGLVVEVVSDIPNKIAIVGHTDSTQYANPSAYDNWDLSSDRAHASRRALTRLGLNPARLSRVEGKSSTEPLLVDDTENPRNRRIAITILRDPSQFMEEARTIGRSQNQQAPGR